MTIVDWLLTYAVHSTLLLGAVWLLARRGLLATPRLQDTFWKMALAGGVLTASLQLGLDVGSWGGRIALDRTDAAASVSAAAAPVDPVTRPSLEPVPLLQSRRTDVAPSTVSPAPTLEPTGAPLLAAREPARFTLPSLGVAVLWLWALVAGASLLRFAVLRRRLTRRLGRRAPVTDAETLALLEELRASAGIRRRVRLTCSKGLSSPVALGLAEICLPGAALVELDRDQRRSVLAHELAHIARFDPLWLLVACLLERALPFQPLNRVARRRMQDAAEYLCDDWAVRSTGSGLTMAKSLVKVAEWIQAGPVAPRAVPLSGMAEHPSQLLSRVHRLIENHAMTMQPTTRWRLPLALALLVLTAGAAPAITIAERSRTVQQPDVAPPEESGLEALGAAGAVLAHPSDELPMIDIEATSEAVLADLGVQGTDARPMPTPMPQPTPVIAGDVDWTDESAQPADSATVRALIQALGDADAGVRRAAAASLGELEDPRAVEPLVAVLRDADPTVRAAAAHALGELEDGRAATALAAAVRDSAPAVRQTAVWALSQLDDPRAVEPLIGLVKDADPEVRRMVAHALGELEDRRGVDPLVGLLADADADVRKTALWGLGEMQDQRAASAVAARLGDAEAEVRKTAAWALGEMELSAAPEPLIGALGDRDPEVRRTAVWAVGEMRDARAVPKLRQLLSDADADVRKTAAWALGEIRDPAAREALVGALQADDPVVRRQAAAALGDRN